MAAPVPTPSGVVKVTHHTGAGGFGYMLSYTGGTPTVAALNTLATACKTEYSAHLAALQSSNSALTSTTVVDLANPSNPEGADNTSVAGTRTGQQAPLQCAAILDYTVNRRYRGSKPKSYLPFGCDADLANTFQWSTTFQTAVDSAWSSYISALSGTPFGSQTVGVQVAVSYYEGKTTNPNPNSSRRFVPTPRATPLIMTVETAALRLVLGSQRRRR